MTAHRSTTREWLGRLGLLAASLGLALLGAELGLRWLSPGYSPLFLDVYRMDAHGLVLLQPDVKRRHVTAEWRVNVRANAHGLRDYDRPRPDSGGTVLGLGDSFAFGWGVELEEGLLAQAESLLAPKAVRVIKAGIPGSGPTDHLRFVQQYGAAYAPDIVALSVFVGNDFTDVQMGGIPGQFTVRNGLMVKSAVEGEEGTPPLWYRAKERLKESSLLAQQAAQVLWYFEQTFLAPQDRVNPGLNARDRWLWEFAKVHLKTLPPETADAYALTLKALDDIAGWCREHDARLVLIVIPRSFQIYDWELERWKEAYGLAPGDLDLDRPQRTVVEWGARRRVPVLDLLPAFRAQVATHANQRLYFYPNSHMNRNGHAIAGQLVAARLGTILDSIPTSRLSRR